MRVAQYSRYGPPDVINIVSAPDPGPPGPHEVLVQVVAAGLNPADSKMRRGQLPLTDLPARMGREFGGVAIEVGSEVTSIQVGQQVLGTGQGVMADLVVVHEDLVMPKPDGITIDHAAVLPVAAQTAWVAVESQNVQPEEVVVVSAAAGGVGNVMCQLLRDKGAFVIGTASPLNHEKIAAMRVGVVDYHGHLAKNIEKMAPKGLHHVFDNSGGATIEAALELGVPRENINSISGDGPKYGVPTVGRVGLDKAVITALAQRIAEGSLIIPILTQPFDEIRKAYIDMEEVRTYGKNVVRMDNTIADMPDFPPRGDR